MCGIVKEQLAIGRMGIGVGGKGEEVMSRWFRQNRRRKWWCGHVNVVVVVQEEHMTMWLCRLTGKRVVV
jgi:hypothetical protein